MTEDLFFHFEISCEKSIHLFMKKFAKKLNRTN